MSLNYIMDDDDISRLMKLKLILPAGLEAFCFPSFLSAGLFGESTESKNKNTSQRSLRLCGEKILLLLFNLNKVKEHLYS